MKASRKQITYQQLKNFLNDGKKDFQNIVCIGADLSNCDLSEVNFTGADLSFASFENADLRKANFTSASLMWSNFARAKMQDVIMKNANVEWSAFVNNHFGKADLTDANFSSCLLQNVHYENAERHGLNTTFSIEDVSQLSKEGIISSYEALKKWKGHIPANLWLMVEAIIARHEQELALANDLSSFNKKEIVSFMSDVQNSVREYTESGLNPYKKRSTEYATGSLGSYRR